MERGVPVRQGLQYLRAELPRILATPPDILSARIVRAISDLAEDWRAGSISGVITYRLRLP